mmetsp:Transcript_12390/g.36003  ORF Transcript_12390/g.36003 Transcript_12390/m.36003 type:complete len:329 (+) Transcript_12390:323-1309(+)
MSAEEDDLLACQDSCVCSAEAPLVTLRDRKSWLQAFADPRQVVEGNPGLGVSVEEVEVLKVLPHPRHIPAVRPADDKDVSRLHKCGRVAVAGRGRHPAHLGSPSVPLPGGHIDNDRRVDRLRVLVAAEDEDVSLSVLLGAERHVCGGVEGAAGNTALGHPSPTGGGGGALGSFAAAQHPRQTAVFRFCFSALPAVTGESGRDEGERASEAGVTTGAILLDLRSRLIVLCVRGFVVGFAIQVGHLEHTPTVALIPVTAGQVATVHKQSIRGLGRTLVERLVDVEYRRDALAVGWRWGRVVCAAGRPAVLARRQQGGQRQTPKVVAWAPR